MCWLQRWLNICNLVCCRGHCRSWFYRIPRYRCIGIGWSFCWPDWAHFDSDLATTKSSCCKYQKYFSVVVYDLLAHKYAKMLDISRHRWHLQNLYILHLQWMGKYFLSKFVSKIAYKIITEIISIQSFDYIEDWYFIIFWWLQ